MQQHDENALENENQALHFHVNTVKKMSVVGIVYDESFAAHKDPLDEAHVERPERVILPYRTLVERNILPKLQIIQSRKATVDEICLVHTKEYVCSVSDAQESATHILADFDLIDNSEPTYFSNLTYETAILAAGSALELTEAVISGKVDSGFALIRPPGHHADSFSAAGFCYFNNIAIAARYAQSKGVSRILIVDWDVHHGNGTQDIFYEDDSVLFISLHRYNTYPSLEKAKADRVGEGKGRGYNINIAFDGEEKMGDGDFKHAFEEIVVPVAKAFKPELILISCGFDAARGDPLGEYDLTVNGYSWMTSQLLQVTPKVALYYEGGYNLDNLCEGVSAVILTLLGEKIPEEIKIPACQDGLKSVENCKEHIRDFWFR